MAVRSSRTGQSAGEQFWRCTRYPTCRGRREVSAPQAPASTRRRAATAQALFEARSARLRARRRWLPRALGGGAPALRAARDEPAGGHLKGLEESGYVVLHARVLPGGRMRLDHLVIGPTGVYAVEVKAWSGQLAVEGERLYVDGRRRDGITEASARVAATVQDLLVGDLKPLGVQVVPVMCFPRSDAALFSRRVGGVVVTGARGLARSIREGDAVLDLDQVLALAMAADEMLEPASRPA